MEESEQQRRNRELIELLNELRVMLPGVQVLFAFLLTMPFTRRFADLDHVDRYLYLAALILTVIASIVLTTPSAYHRFVFRQHRKEELLAISNRLALLGMTLLALAISCALYVVTDFLFGTAVGAVVTAVVGALFVLFWYVLPLYRLSHMRQEAPDAAEASAAARSLTSQAD